jgi:hypothetical protein
MRQAPFALELELVLELERPTSSGTSSRGIIAQWDFVKIIRALAAASGRLR